MTPVKRKAWRWLRNDMRFKPPEQLGTAEEIALNAFSFGWAKGSADGAAEAREECAGIADTWSQHTAGREIAKIIRARGSA